MSYLGWRWTEYITTIMGFLGVRRPSTHNPTSNKLTSEPQLALEIFLLEETYPPVILVNKATELRRRTRNWGIHAKQEEIEVDLRELLEKNLSRPLRLLYTEPIILAVSVYMAFVYGIFYLFLTFYPIVFQRIHGMNEGVGGVS
jgi:DHA1 family multidrug resistance protein-like MFS transporter